MSYFRKTMFWVRKVKSVSGVLCVIFILIIIQVILFSLLLLVFNYASST